MIAKWYYFPFEGHPQYKQDVIGHGMIKEGVFQKRLKSSVPKDIQFTVTVGQRRSIQRLKLSNFHCPNPFSIIIWISSNGSCSKRVTQCHESFISLWLLWSHLPELCPTAESRSVTTAHRSNAKGQNCCTLALNDVQEEEERLSPLHPIHVMPLRPPCTPRWPVCRTWSHFSPLQLVKASHRADTLCPRTLHRRSVTGRHAGPLQMSQGLGSSNGTQPSLLPACLRDIYAPRQVWVEGPWQKKSVVSPVFDVGQGYREGICPEIAKVCNNGLLHYCEALC